MLPSYRKTTLVAFRNRFPYRCQEGGKNKEKKKKKFKNKKLKRDKEERGEKEKEVQKLIT